MVKNRSKVNLRRFFLACVRFTFKRFTDYSSFPLAPCYPTVLNHTMCMCWRVHLLDNSSDEWTQHGFPGTFQSFVPAPWWIPPGLRRTCILPSRHIAPWCCSPGSHPWCSEPNVPPCKYQWILTHSWQNNGVDVFHVLIFIFYLFMITPCGMYTLSMSSW